MSVAWQRFFHGAPEVAGGAQCLPAALPWLIDASNWQQIEAGVRQRARLLQEIMADVYGPQRLLDQGLLPAELVFGQPGYLRAMHGVTTVGGTYLRLLAFDLTHQPDGRWCVLGQHCQVPAGWGHLLRNRAGSARRLPAALEALAVRPLAGSFDALLRALRQSCAPGSDAPLALLSPGHPHPDYAEHSWLARELGLALLRASELTVHDQALCLKTLEGLLPVPALVKLVHDDELDPLELRADAQFGVPGLLQAVRAGSLRLANAPGSGLLEAALLAACLPALSRHLLGAALELASAEPAGGRASQLPLLRRAADCETGQWRMGSVTLRVFAWLDANRAWQVLPGGLTCVAGAPSQDGDVWVFGGETPAAASAAPNAPWQPRHGRTPLSRRAAEQLFWLGRYSQRCADVTALAGLTMKYLAAGNTSSPTLLAWLGNLALQNSLLAADGSMPWLDQHAFLLALRARLEPAPGAGCIADRLNEAAAAAASVLEHLPEPHAQAINDAQALLVAGSGHAERGPAGAPGSAAWLNAASAQLAAIMALQAGAQVQAEVRRLLAIGHGVERLGFQTAALRSGLLSGTLQTADGLHALRELFHGGALALPAASAPALLAGLLTGVDEATSSLGACARRLRECLAGPAGAAPDPLSRSAWRVPDPFSWELEAGGLSRLDELLLQCQSDTFALSDAICSTCASDAIGLPASA